MKLNDFAKPMKAKDHYVKAAFGGFPGGGKTYTATELLIGLYPHLKIEAPLLMIDNEGGHRWIMSKFKGAGLEAYLKNTNTIPDIKESIKLLNSGEIGVLFIDSLTNIYKKYVSDYREKNRKTFMTLQDWGNILPAWEEDFNIPFKEATGNIIFTGRGGHTYEMEEDERGKKAFVKSGVKMKVASETGHEPDLIIWMESIQDMKDGEITTHNQMQFIKSRYAPYHGKVFVNPTYEIFRPIIDELLAFEVGDVSGVTNKDGGAPSENYETKRDHKEIALEEVKGAFDRIGFGTSKEEKQIKAELTMKSFGTTSGKAIAKLALEDIQSGARLLIEMLEHYELKRGEFESVDAVVEWVKAYETALPFDEEPTQ